MGLSYDSYLAHYGVKGMKWGVRKKRSSQGKSGYKAVSYTHLTLPTNREV